MLRAENTYQLYHATRMLDEASGDTSGVNTVSNDEGSSGEGAEHSQTVETAIMVVSLLLILLTIAFEIVKEHIEENAKGAMETIIESLFGEMTILGFLSMFSFTVSKTGVFEHISKPLFGEEKELEEIFESVHYMLFFIMVSFVVIVLILVNRAKDIEANWFVLNDACLNDAVMKNLDTLMLEEPPVEKGWFLSTFCPCTKTKAQRLRAELHVFRKIREEFISDTYAQEPNRENTVDSVTKSFHFGRYLAISLGKELAHIVHVSVFTWSFFALLTLIFYGIMWFINENEGMEFAWLWAASAWVMYCADTCFDSHIANIVREMMPPPSNPDEGQLESGALLSPLPLWTKITLEQRTKKYAKQDTLYWKGRNGPKFFLIFSQIQLVHTSAFLSILFFKCLPLMHKEKGTSTLFITYVVVTILPIFLIFYDQARTTRNLAIVTSIGVHRRPRVVDQVIREQKTHRIIRTMVTVQKLQIAARDGFSKSTKTLSETELAEVTEIFNSLDKTKNGTIETTELKHILECLGASVTATSLKIITDELDCNLDGHIDKAEFIKFYSANISFVGTNIRDLAHSMFQEFDKNQSKDISLAEFKTIVDACNVGFTVDEIADLVTELDEQDNGSVSENEFFDLLEKHKDLFEEKKDLKLT